MSIQESMSRMEATKSIGNNIEWLNFKSDILKVMDAVAQLESIEKIELDILKCELKKLKSRNSVLTHKNRKHVNDKADLKKALSVILSDSQQGID